MIKRKSVASDLGNARAILARAEQVVDDVLRTRYVCQCWKLDEEAAARMLRYFRRKAAGAPDNDQEWQAVVAFCGEHGQSLDWITGFSVERSAVRIHSGGMFDRKCIQILSSKSPGIAAHRVVAALVTTLA